jgi:hypothetical protein
VSDMISGLVVLGSIREQAEQARESKSVRNIPPWPLHQLLLSDLLEFHPKEEHPFINFISSAFLSFFFLSFILSFFPPFFFSTFSHYTPVADSFLPSSQSHPYKSLLPSLLLEKRDHPTLVHLVPVSLSNSSHTVAHLDSPGRGRGFNGQ